MRRSSRCRRPIIRPKIVWRGQFGTSPDTPNEVYCLMGNNFLRAPVSADFQKLITNWQAKHPHAKIVRVFNYGPILNDRPNLSQTYVWVVDGRSNLNEYLVQQGGCPGTHDVCPAAHESSDRPEESHFLMEIPEKDLRGFPGPRGGRRRSRRRRQKSASGSPAARLSSHSRVNVVA